MFPSLRTTRSLVWFSGLPMYMFEPAMSVRLPDTGSNSDSMRLSKAVATMTPFGLSARPATSTPVTKAVICLVASEYLSIRPMPATAPTTQKYRAF